MYTQCPHCQAYFEVSADQLKVGDGDVRCGRCLSIFHALSYLSEALPEQEENTDDLFGDEPKHSPASIHQEPELGDINNISNTTSLWSGTDQKEILADTDASNISIYEYNDDDNHNAAIHPIDLGYGDTDTGSDKNPPDTLLDEPVTPAEADTPPALARDDFAEQVNNVEPIDVEHISDGGNDAGPTTNLPAPLLRQLQEEKAASLRPPATRWVIGNLLMLVLLLAQGSYFYRDELALREPKLRPWLEQACGYLDCTIQRPTSQAKIDILGWDVRSLPDTPQALLASTTLVNKTPATQPYPLLTLRFSDINGTPLAQRRFLPREYLPSDTDIKAGMTPDTPVIIELALVDPGKQAVNFEFHTEPAKSPQ